MFLSKIGVINDSSTLYAHITGETLCTARAQPLSHALAAVELRVSVRVVGILLMVPTTVPTPGVLRLRQSQIMTRPHFRYIEPMPIILVKELTKLGGSPFLYLSIWSAGFCSPIMIKSVDDTVLKMGSSVRITLTIPTRGL